eukprot:COSAG01_NODE_4699_length_4804_cov_17.017216_3_plen_264_part_00
MADGADAAMALAEDDSVARPSPAPQSSASSLGDSPPTRHSPAPPTQQQRRRRQRQVVSWAPPPMHRPRSGFLRQGGGSPSGPGGAQGSPLGAPSSHGRSCAAVPDPSKRGLPVWALKPVSEAAQPAPLPLPPTPPALMCARRVGRYLSSRGPPRRVWTAVGGSAVGGCRRGPALLPRRRLLRGSPWLRTARPAPRGPACAARSTSSSTPAWWAGLRRGACWVPSRHPCPRASLEAAHRGRCCRRRPRSRTKCHAGARSSASRR